MGHRLFFRNWQDVALFPATRDEGRALRKKIGQGSLLALVTLRDIRKSPTRSGAYEGHVTHAAGAGGTITGKPPYDLLKNTDGVNPIAREIALLTCTGSVPVF